ncbi:Crp/Fnr family transcriptional regulator [Enterococcus olivae]
MFPRNGLFKDTVYPFTAIAYTNIEIVSIPVKVFEEIISRTPKQLMKWIEIQSDIMEMNIIKIQKGSVNNANQRVITTLAILHKGLGEYQELKGISTISYPLTINDLSKASGTTRETTSSILKRLIKQKKISYLHKHLTFLDTDFFNSVLND